MLNDTLDAQKTVILEEDAMWWERGSLLAKFCKYSIFAVAAKYHISPHDVLTWNVIRERF